MKKRRKEEEMGNFHFIGKMGIDDGSGSGMVMQIVAVV